MVATTHGGFGKVADGTSTRVMAYMINRWRVKIDWKRVYNRRDPSRMRDRRKKAEREKRMEAVAVCMILKTPVT